MKNSIIIIIILISIIAACRKGIGYDEQYIRGRLFLTDTITGSKKDVPVKNKQVFLAMRGDTLNYLYITHTDSEGYFTFNLLSNKDNDFTIYAYDSSATKDFFYKGSKDVSRGDKDVVLQLYPSTSNQNGLVLKAVDQQGSTLPTVSFKLYSNSTLAFANSSNGFIPFSSDSFGRGYKVNLAAGDYWVNADRVIDTFNFQRIGKKITVSKSGFINDTIMLFKKTAVSGLNFTLVDATGAAVSNAQVRIYSNLAMAQVNDASAVMFTDVSDANGKLVRNLAQGTYYLNAYKQSGIDTFRRIARVVNIPANGAIVTDTMLLHKTTQLVNGFKLQAKDSLGGILPVTKLFFYNSELLALQNSATGAGSFGNTDTDVSGFGGAYNIPAGDYYINARKQVDTVVYQRVARKVTVNASGIFTDTIQLRRKW